MITYGGKNGLEMYGNSLHTVLHTHTHTWCTFHYEVIHGRNGFYTVQTVFSISLL